MTPTAGMSVTRPRIVHPPGFVDAFCTRCKREVVVHEDFRLCPHCETEVDPLSLPTVPAEAREAARVAREAAAPVSPRIPPVASQPAPAGKSADQPAVQQVKLRRRPLAERWLTQTEALIASLAAEEEALLPRLNEISEQIKAIRRELKALRQIAAIVVLEDAPVRPASADSRYRIGPEYPRGERKREKWSVKFDLDACRICGASERRHGDHGRCARCAQHHRKYGTEWTPKETTS